MQTVVTRSLTNGEWVNNHLKPRAASRIIFRWNLQESMWASESALTVYPRYIKLDIRRHSGPCDTYISKGWDVSVEYPDNTIETAIKWFRNSVLSGAHSYLTHHAIRVSTICGADCTHTQFTAGLLIVPYKRSQDTLIVPNI